MALLDSGNDGGANGGTVTLNTVGATLIVVASGSYYSYGPGAVLSDDQSNTWTALTEYGTDGQAKCRFWYCQNPNTNAAHQITISTSGKYIGFSVAAFDDTFDASAQDQANGSGSASNDTSEQPGSVTPTEDGALIVTTLVLDNAFTNLAITESFTIAENRAWVDQSMGHALAYKYQAAAAAINPQWSWTTTRNNAAAIATFKANYSPGGGVTFYTITELTIGSTVG